MISQSLPEVLMLPRQCTIQRVILERPDFHRLQHWVSSNVLLGPVLKGGNSLNRKDEQLSRWMNSASSKE